MKILFLSGWFPYPTNNGSKLRIYNLIRGLAEHHDISLLSFTNEVDSNLTNGNLQKYCRDIQVIPTIPFNPYSLRSRLGYLSPIPRSRLDTFSNEMADSINRAVRTQNFDLVIASQIQTAGYGQFLEGLPALFEEVEIGIFHDRLTQSVSPWHRFRHWLTWLKYRKYLGTLLLNFQACTVVSEQEKQLVKNATKYQNVEVIPNSVHLSEYEEIQENAQPNSLIFTGSFSYFPNYEAMIWFLDEVFPHVRKKIPDICLRITGNHGDRPLPSLDRVHLTGYVEDVRPLVAQSWCSIVPIKTGGGTRLKVLEAMALRTPVISTSKGAEGLDAEPGKHLLIADTPQEFVDATINLLNSSALRQLLVDNAYQLIREKYDWAIVMPQFLNLVDRVSQSRVAG